MPTRCAYGKCNSDTRYPERCENVQFFPFPKPRRRLDECKIWIRCCSRPHCQLNTDKVTKNTYVCSKHFPDPRGPTDRYPYPIPADGSRYPLVRPPPKRRRIEEQYIAQENEKERTNFDDDTDTASEFEQEGENKGCQTDAQWCSPMDLLTATAELQKKQETINKLEQKIGVDCSRKRLLHSAVPSVFGDDEDQLEPELNIGQVAIKIEEGMHEDGETQDELWGNGAVGESGCNEVTPVEQESNHTDESNSEPSTIVSTLNSAAGGARGKKRKIESRHTLKMEMLRGLKEDFKEKKKVWDEELKMLMEERKKRFEEVKMNMEVYELKMEYYKLKIKKIKDTMG